MKRGCMSIKDPVYGYMDIPAEYMNGIVDTACFQRIRRIIYSSYAPLYPTAVHNRFGHSLGVYFLGNIAAERLLAEIRKKYGRDMDTEMKNFWKKMGKIFELACLLHDVGHAPFSHTGEYFFLTDGEYTELHEELKKMVGTDSFEQDVPMEKKNAAHPHEIMSAMIGIEEFSKKFFREPKEKEFFARCITGYRYSDERFESQVLNCFISLLNGNVIDVDKLDYLLRDAYVLGFSSVTIDYERLLSNLTIVEIEGKYELAYYKGAISVIENIVYAHDSERKWLQSNPVVLYETYLLQQIISHLCDELDKNGKKLFSRKTLTKEGQRFDGNIFVSLMSDDDIVYLMKNVYPNEYSEEYLDRVHRYRPIWRSEAEYKAFFMDGKRKSKAFRELESALAEMAKYLGEKGNDGRLNRKLIEKLEDEIIEIKYSRLRDEDKENLIASKKKMQKMVECLVDYKNRKKMEDDFIIIKATQFYSGFGKTAFADINVSFYVGGGEEKIAKVGDILSSLDAKEKDNDDFFYLFYRQGEDGENMLGKCQEICDTLLEAFGDKTKKKKVEKQTNESKVGMSYSYRRI